ncbi:MAG TPA: hypothetical protein VE075_07470 [Thermoanaerobaculia bacterium]|nr:hypothetical protein [Thermoanaerobaculia bacterium]
MGFALALACGMLGAAAASASEEAAAGARGPAAPAGHVRYIPVRGTAVDAAAGNLIYNGGPVIPSAKVVFIFWGPSFGNASSPDHLYAQELQAFRNQFGSTPEYNVITQYYQNPGTQHIQLTNLGAGTPDWFDGSTPPTNVTDAIVIGEVGAYLGSHAFDASTIYEVVIPSASYSSSGGTTSCGGPNLVYCAYHSYFQSGANTVKYSIEPYPSCGGCQVPGFTAAENQEHFVTHETREAVTDQQINAWLDSGGNEADDKCAWSPSPFIGTGGYGYQYEWSNAVSSCVKSIPVSPPPTVTTSLPSSISATAATLAGMVNPNGAGTSAYFQWGLTPSYGNTTSSQGVGSGTAAVPYSLALSGLACATTYHFRAAASSGGGMGFGADEGFTTGTCPASFFTVTPCRLLDTRNTSPLTNGGTYEFEIAESCGVPTTAKAASVNVTAVDATAPGFLGFWPAQTPYPGTSIINFKAGQVRANNAILVLGTGSFGQPGSVWVTFGASSSGSVDLLIDINGYFQ